jgi:hypothetical protein
MKGVSFITDETHKKRFVQIELKTLERYSSYSIEDFLDIVIAESRKGDKKISWQAAKRQLKKAGKL